MPHDPSNITPAGAADPLVGTALTFQADQPHRITIEPVRDEFWFAVLERFVDEIMPYIGGADTKIMMWFFRRRDRFTSRVIETPPVRLQDELCLSRSQVYRSLRVLMSITDLGTRKPLLLEALPGDAWLVCPACRFKGTPVQPTGRSAPPVQMAGRLSRIWDESSSRLDKPPSGTKETRARVDPDSRRILDDECRGSRGVDDDVCRHGQEKTKPVDIRELAQIVEALTRGIPECGLGGFARRRAEKIAGQYDWQQIRIAIRNAIAKSQAKDPGKVLRDFTGYVISQLENGCTLFQTMQRQDDAAKRNEDLLRRAVETLAPSDEDAAAVHAWFSSLGTAARARLFDRRELERADGLERLFGHALNCARRAGFEAVRRPPAPEIQLGPCFLDDNTPAGVHTGPTAEDALREDE